MIISCVFLHDDDDDDKCTCLCPAIIIGSVVFIVSKSDALGWISVFHTTFPCFSLSLSLWRRTLRFPLLLSVSPPTTTPLHRSYCSILHFCAVRKNHSAWCCCLSPTSSESLLNLARFLSNGNNCAERSFIVLFLMFIWLDSEN